MISYRYCIEICETIGMDVDPDDGLAFTVSGGQLTSGAEAPPSILAMNGWDVELIARKVLSMTGDFREVSAMPRAGEENSNG